MPLPLPSLSKSLLTLGLLSSLNTLAWANPTQMNATAEEKILFIKNEISKNIYRSSLPTAAPSTGQMLNLLRPSYLIKTLNNKSDLMIEGRQKLIHTYGSIAEVEFIPTQNPVYRFKGMARSGAIGFLRASLAKGGDVFTPGIAIKFPVSYKQSVDIIAMETVDGQGSNRNFFAKVFATKIPNSKDRSLLPLELAFKAVAKLHGLMNGNCEEDAQILDVSSFGKFSQDGEEFSYFPASEEIYQLTFSPTEESSKIISESSLNDFRHDLATVPVGTVLYKVAAFKKGMSSGYEVGTIVLKSQFLPSLFADEDLHFSHKLQTKQ